MRARGGDRAEEPSRGCGLAPLVGEDAEQVQVVDGAEVEVGGLGHVEGVVGMVPRAVEVAVGPGQEGVQVVEVAGRQRCVADPGEVSGEGLDETVEFVRFAGGEESRSEGTRM